MIHDVLIIGAGISGASVAYEVAQAGGNVIMLEAETVAGYHSTGRSAALFTRNYGGPLVRQINAASAPFLASPPDGFCDGPLLSRRGSLTVASAETVDDLLPLLVLSEPGDEVVPITPQEAVARVPYLRIERVAAAIFEANVADIDVERLYQGYLKGFARHGGTIAKGAGVLALHRGAGLWQVETRKSRYQAKIVVNAAGAWAEQVGAMAGARPIGLVPRRRTAIIVDAPAGLDLAGSPAVDFISSGAYIKPEAGKLMASPGDATPTQPQDARPEELDIAHLADWIETETLIPVRRIAHSWAGLRSFVPDEAPVVGFDPRLSGFVWLAGQGGYGIMMAPALAKMTAQIILAGAGSSGPTPSGPDPDRLSPRRLFPQS